MGNILERGEVVLSLRERRVGSVTRLMYLEGLAQFLAQRRHPVMKLTLLPNHPTSPPPEWEVKRHHLGPTGRPSLLLQETNSACLSSCSRGDIPLAPALSPHLPGTPGSLRAPGPSRRAAQVAGARLRHWSPSQLHPMFYSSHTFRVRRCGEPRVNM